MGVNLLSADTRIEVCDKDLADVPDGDATTFYTVRQIPPSEARRMGKAHTTTPLNRAMGRREEVIDQQAYLDDYLDAALVGWRGVLDGGQPAELTRENKLRLDPLRKSALIALAGLNQTSAEVRDASFRGAS